MAYIRTCVQNLGEIRRPVRNNCPSSLIIDTPMFSTPGNTPSMVSYMQYEPFYQKSNMAADHVVFQKNWIDICFVLYNK